MDEKGKYFSKLVQENSASAGFHVFVLLHSSKDLNLKIYPCLQKSMLMFVMLLFYKKGFFDPVKVYKNNASHIFNNQSQTTKSWPTVRGF